MNQNLFFAAPPIICLVAGCVSPSSTDASKNVPHGHVAPKPVLESPQMASDMTKQTVEFKLGDDKIQVVVHEKRPSTLTMINVHHDESTSVAAGMASLKQHGGRLIEFVHPGGRLIAFRLDGQNYTFDPNRVFSD